MLEVVNECQIDSVNMKVEGDIWNISTTDYVTWDGLLIILPIFNILFDLIKHLLFFLLWLFLFPAKHATEESSIFIILFFNRQYSLLNLCLFYNDLPRPYVKVSWVNPKHDSMKQLRVPIISQVFF